MTCCLNTTGATRGCSPCRRCAFRERRGSEVYHCKNTTCIESKYCWVHGRARYGVQIKEGTHGRSLFAARDFGVGDIIAPLGGAFIEDQWEDLVQGPATALYGYRVKTPVRPVLHRRPDGHGTGFLANMPAHALRVAWPASEPTAHDKHLVLAAVQSRGRRGQRLFLVHQKEYELFMATLAHRVATRLGISQAVARRKLWKQQPAYSDFIALFDPRQFEAYMDIARWAKSNLDASCNRGAGSYANDAATIRVAPDGELVIQSQNRGAVNAYIDGYGLYPLDPSGWLRASKPIPAGTEILLEYGEKYWRNVHKVRYGLSTVKADRGAVTVRVGGQVRPQDQRCTLR